MKAAYTVGIIVVILVIASVVGYTFLLGTTSTTTSNTPATQTVTATNTQTATSVSTAISTVTASKATLHVVTWGGSYYQTMSFLANEFTNQTGIPVVIGQQAAGGQTLAKMQASWPNTGIDVVTVPAGVGAAMMNLGYLVPLNSSNLPVYSQIPTSFDVSSKGTTYALGFELGTFVLAWRTDLYPTGLTGFQSLMAPALKGHVGIPSVTFFDDAFLLNLAIWKGGNESNIQPGIDAGKQLASSVGYVYSGDQQAVTAIQTGQVSAEYMITADFLQARNSMNSSSPVINATAVFNDTKSITALDVITVPKGPNEAEALEFVNFVMSAQSQSYWGEHVGIIPANSQASVPAILKPYIPTVSAAQQESYIPDPVIVSQNVGNWTNEWNAEVQPLIG